jgi:hypothetical protein
MSSDNGFTQGDKPTVTNVTSATNGVNVEFSDGTSYFVEKTAVIKRNFPRLDFPKYVKLFAVSHPHSVIGNAKKIN